MSSARRNAVSNKRSPPTSFLIAIDDTYLILIVNPNFANAKFGLKGYTIYGNRDT